MNGNLADVSPRICLACSELQNAVAHSGVER